MRPNQTQIEARRNALAEDVERYEVLRRVHIEIAHVLEDPSSPNARALIERASRQIDVLESAKTCSSLYVKAWRRVLRNPGPKIRRLAEGRKGMEDAMLQNSPFGFALRDPNLNKAHTE